MGPNMINRLVVPCHGNHLLLSVGVVGWCDGAG